MISNQCIRGIFNRGVWKYNTNTVSENWRLAGGRVNMIAKQWHISKFLLISV